MGLLIFGTIWFWLLLIAAFSLIIYFLESSLDHDDGSSGGIQATGIVVGFIVLYYILGSGEHIRNIGHYIANHVGTVSLLFLGYLSAGVVWAFVKWYFFLLSKRDVLKQKLNANYTYGAYSIEHDIPTANKNKARIVSWMTYWPFSGVWTLINDPVRRAFQFVYRNIESTFNKISNNMFADERLLIEKKIEEAKKEHEERQTKKTTKPSGGMIDRL